VIVVDTNLIAYLHIEGERTAQVQQVLRKDPEWAVPFLWRSEFRNVLALYLRQQVFSLDDAQAIMQQAESFLQGREYEVSSRRVLDIVMSSHCSAYDCEFIVLAQDLQCPLVTADRQILLKFPATAMSPESFILQGLE